MDDNHEHEHVHDDQHNGKNNEHQHQQQQQQKFCHDDEQQGTDGQSQGRRTQKSDIQCCPPIFINTTEALEQLRYNLSQRRPSPYHVPKMIAIDS